MSADKEKDVLEEIRDRLGDLPLRLAEELRQGRQTRFAGAARNRATADDGSGDRWHATEQFLGATGLPILSELAQAMRDARTLHDAWTRFAEAWKPAAQPPMAQPIPFAEPVPTFGLQPEGQAAARTLAQSTPLPQGYGTLPDDWRKSFLKENEIQVDDATLAEFRARMAELKNGPPIPFGADYKPSAPPAPTVLPEPYSMKPDDWRPQPFEVLPEERWQPAAPAAEPAWMSQKPDISFAQNWPREEKPDIKPLRETPEGWRDVQPLLPLMARQGWSEAMEGGGESDNGEQLHRIADLLEELVNQGKEHDTGQLPPRGEGTPAKESVGSSLVRATTAGSASHDPVGGMAKHMVREGLLRKAASLAESLMG